MIELGTASVRSLVQCGPGRLPPDAPESAGRIALARTIWCSRPSPLPAKDCCVKCPVYWDHATS